ncbi:MAG: M28 family peptidase, partial [Acidobacteria bacterium]|nr:M28 family peptidase [Acidobacteriota bacterium]
ITDGEEPGLMGAAAVVTDPAVAQVRAFINVDSIGSGHPSMLFQATPGSDWLLHAWARRAPRPRGGSYAIEIYRRLPNDTDFTVFQAAGLQGLNFASVGDGYSYHTARDIPERVTTRVLYQTGINIVGITQALDEMDLPQRQVVARAFDTIDEAERTRQTTVGTTYFSVLERFGLVYSSLLSRIVAALATVMGFVAVFRLWRTTPDITTRVIVWTTVWSCVGIVAVTAATIGATWALRAAREVYHPWYAHPMRLLSLLIVCAAATIWMLRQAGFILPRVMRGGTHPALVWIVTLPVWIGLTALIEWKGASAAYLWSVPLLCTSIFLIITGGRHAPFTRLASIASFIVCAVLWIPDGLVVFSFAVAALAREPLVTPIFVYAGLLLLVGHMTAPPFIAAISGRTRQLWQPSLTTGIWLLLIVISAGFAYAAPAYTHERSLRRDVRYINDGVGRRAFWEIASNEPGLDVDLANGPQGWQPVSDPPPASFPVRRLLAPFAFRTAALADSPPPAVIRATMTPSDRGLQAEITVVPTEAGLTVSFALPPRLLPSGPNLAGVIRNGRWTATYVAPPPEGVTFRALFAGTSEETLRDAAVLVQSAGLPDGAGWQRLPAWLPQERTVWNAYSLWIVPVMSRDEGPGTRDQ